MNEEMVLLPEIKEIRELIEIARRDIAEEIEENPDAADQSKLMFQLIEIIEEKIGSIKDIAKLNDKEKIDLAAHLNFLHCLLEDFFFDEDMAEEDEEDEEEYLK